MQARSTFGFALDCDDRSLHRQVGQAPRLPLRERLRLVWPGAAATSGRLQWVRRGDGLDLLRWGWRKRVWDEAAGHWLWRPLTTARVESLRRSATWREAWQAGQRCLIPITRWFEDGPEGRTELQLAEAVEPSRSATTPPPLAWLAGLWLPGTPWDHVLPLTAPAGKLWRGRLRRVPVVVPADAHDWWLGAELGIETGIHHARVWQPAASCPLRRACDERACHAA